MPTTEELEEQTAELERQLAEARAKKNPQKASKPRKHNPPRKDGEVLAGIQADQRVKLGNSTLKNSHSGFAGKSIIEKIERQMDKRREIMKDMIVESGGEVRKTEDYILQKGRYQGFAGTLALLRSSTVAAEIGRSDERLGIE